MVNQPSRHVEEQKAQTLGAVSSSVGRASRFSAGSTLCAVTTKRSHAALAPKYFEGSTPPAKSFLITSCTRSMVPAL